MLKSTKWRRIVAGVLCLILVAGIAMATAETRKIQGANLVRLRAKPSTSGKVLDAFPKGRQVTILKKGDDWCKVKVGGKEGYMMTKYLYSKKEQKEAEEEKGTVMYVSTPSGAKLNLRADKSNQSEILGSYKVGTKVTVIKKGKSWTKVNVKGKIGYMGSQYLVSK